MKNQIVIGEVKKYPFVKEDELIILLSRVSLDKELLVQVGGLLKNNLDWNYIVNKSKQEGVS